MRSESVQRSSCGYRRNCGYDRKREYVYGREERLRLLRLRRRRRAFRKRVLTVAAVVAAALVLGTILSGFSGMAVTKAPSYTYYTAVTVHRGETLWSIASSHMTEEYASVNDYIREIKEVNGMKSSNLDYGQKLILPYFSPEVF